MSKVLQPEKEYKEFLAQGRFMLLKDNSCNRFIYHPRIIGPGTGSVDLQWIEASGRGTVYSFTVISRKPPEKDYNVVLVDLEEGPRMMSRVDGLNVERLEIGMPVKSRIIQEAGQAIVVFEAVAS